MPLVTILPPEFSLLEFGILHLALGQKHSFLPDLHRCALRSVLCSEMTGNRQVRESCRKTSSRLCESHAGEGGEEVPPSERTCAQNLQPGDSLQAAERRAHARGAVFSFPLHVLPFS